MIIITICIAGLLLSVRPIFLVITFNLPMISLCFATNPWPSISCNLTNQVPLNIRVHFEVLKSILVPVAFQYNPADCFEETPKMRSFLQRQILRCCILLRLHCLAFSNHGFHFYLGVSRHCSKHSNTS